MSTKVLMLGFNEFSVDSGIAALSSARNNFRVLSTLLTHERGGVYALEATDIECHPDLLAIDARALISEAIKECKDKSMSLILYITGHGLMANPPGRDDVFVVPTLNATKLQVLEGKSDFCLDIGSDVLNELRKKDSPQSTLILDCCSSNNAIKQSDIAGVVGTALDIETMPIFGENKEKFAIIATAGAGQSAWETKWTSVSPCRSGLKKKYEAAGLDEGTVITNFVGALVDTWGLSDIEVPDNYAEMDIVGEENHFEAATLLDTDLLQNYEGLVSVSSGVRCAAKLLDAFSDNRLRQKVSIKDPKNVATNQYLFRVPAPSRQEKLTHLKQYMQDHDSISDSSKSKILALISRGLEVCEGKVRDQFPNTTYAFEKELYKKSINSSKAEFVESFLLGSVQHDMSKEINARVSKSEEATKNWIKNKRELSDNLAKAQRKFRISLGVNLALGIAFTFTIAILFYDYISFY